MGRRKGSLNKPKDPSAEPNKPKKAAKVESAAPEPVADPASPANQARRVITQNQFNDLMTEVTTFKGRADTNTGKLREAIAKAVRDNHLNKEVFALVRKLDRKEPEALLLFLEDLELYLDLSGLNQRADSVGVLPLAKAEAEEPETPVAEAEAGTEAKVSRPNFGRREVLDPEAARAAAAGN